MKYNVGMYGGSFDPLHLGHIHDIIKAVPEQLVTKMAEIHLIRLTSAMPQAKLVANS
jgi:nicotinic acid mononucleotide adenylyltransferase